MARPDQRPLRRLPQLEERRAELERCVFCPKLCRTACPVSNAEPRETLTPWGKMSMAYFVGNESVEASQPFAAPAWACTGCRACTASCDHENDVTGTLFAARGALAAEGLAPEGARRVAASFVAYEDRVAGAGSELARLDCVRPDAKRAVLVGCAYLTKAPDVARDAVRSVAALSGGEVSLAPGCCGAPLLHAGDARGFAERGARMAQALEGKDSLVVVDAGCASTLSIHHARAGIGLRPKVLPFATFVASAVGALGRDALLAKAGPVRYHDPCQLGRGLGVYDEPRTVLGQALGRAPDEFVHARERGHCSGAGGLLPVTMPEASAVIARVRVDEHLAAGGGTIVTACASSLRSFRRQGARAEDLATVVARALGVAEGHER